jgi:hypothetical protein
MITGPEFAHAVEALLLEHGAIVIHLTDDREVIGFGFGKIFEICLRDHGYNHVYQQVPMLVATPADVAALIEQAGL